MGNPHAVVFMDDVEHLEIEKIGPKFENHPLFPDRVNTEFVKVIDEHTVQMRVWERGSGETLACGTGACAVAVASILNHHVDGNAPVTVKLLGGDLEIFWDREENLVYMTGPAKTVYDLSLIHIFWYSFSIILNRNMYLIFLSFYTYLNIPIFFLDSNSMLKSIFD